MLSISQTSTGFYCIEWSPTEEGPKILKSKFIKTSQKIDDKNLLKNIISSSNSSTATFKLKALGNCSAKLISSW